MKLIRFSGVAAFFLSTISCLFFATQINFDNYPKFAISDFGRDPATGTAFNLAMIISGLLSLAFALYLKSYFKFSLLQILLLIVSSVGLIDLAVFHLPPDLEPVGRAVHWAFGITFFVAFPLGIISVGQALLKSRNDWGKRSIYWGLATLIVGVLIWLVSGRVILVELWGLGAIAAWVVVMTIITD